MIALVIMPIAYIVTGPVASRLGVRETLLVAAAIQFTSLVLVLLTRSVRQLRRVDEPLRPEPALASAPEYESAGPAQPAPLP